MIPSDIENEISARIQNEFPNDKNTQSQRITAEKEAYKKLQEIDAGKYKHIKDDIIKSSITTFKEWTDIYTWTAAQLISYIKIETLDTDNIPSKTIEEWKKQARAKHGNFYIKQLEYLQSRIKNCVSIIETQQKIDSIKGLLIELEEIIGNECYNGNIQNYSSWGELESEGRKFRYPVKFHTDEGETKKTRITPDTPSEELITGHYAFGANELNIYRALFKVIMHLKDKYDLKI